MKLNFKSMNFAGLNSEENQRLKRDGATKIAIVLTHAPIGPDMTLTNASGTRPPSTPIHREGELLCTTLRTQWRNVFSQLSAIYETVFDKIIYASHLRHQQTVEWLFVDYLYPNIRTVSSEELNLKVAIPFGHDKFKWLSQEIFPKILSMPYDEEAVARLAKTTGRSNAEIKTKITQRRQAAAVYNFLRAEANDLDSPECVWAQQKAELLAEMKIYWNMISKGGIFVMSDPIQSVFWGYKLGASSLTDSLGEPILPFEFDMDMKSRFFEFVKPAIGVGACAGALIVFGETGKVMSIQRIGPDPWLMREFPI